MKVWEYQSKENDNLANQVAKDEDIVMTKPEMAQYLLSKVNFIPNAIVMEPCLGKGAFYDNFPKDAKKSWCEINLGKNYLDFGGKVDYTISNPPFVPRKLFWDFHIKAMETTLKEIYWLINMSSLNVFTPKRLTEMHNKSWYLNKMFIVADKRWFGRYVFCKFSKTNTNVLDFSNRIF
jgi:hypothetical protein